MFQRISSLILLFCSQPRCFPWEMPQLPIKTRILLPTAMWKHI